MSAKEKLMSVSEQRLFALGGVIVPILFTGVVIIVGLLHPGYSHVSQTISELGEVGAPYATIMNANIGVSGLLFIAFAYGLHKGIGDGKGSKVGPILVAISGGFRIGVAVFPLPSPLHMPIAVAGFITIMIAPLVISRRLKQDSRWQGYRLYSLATGVTAVILFLALLAGQGGPWYGALQRIFLAPLFIWIEVMAIHLLRLPNQPHPMRT